MRPRHAPCRAGPATREWPQAKAPPSGRRRASERWAALRSAAVALLSTVAAGCADAPGPCRLTLAGEFPLSSERGLITVPVEVNRTKLAMIVDTGAQRSVLSADAASRLGLVGDPRMGTELAGVGGPAIAHPDALIRRLAFADYATGPGSLAVGDMRPIPGGGSSADGLLGEDLLRHFDLDLDLPHGALRLYRVAGCSGSFLPWSRPYAGLPARLSWRHSALIVPAELDGQPVHAVLDTGATGVIVGADAARRAGVTPAALAADRGVQGHGAVGADFALVRHRFATLAVGPLRVAPADLLVLDRPLPEGDLLLGLAWLRRQPVWISYATRQVFVALPDEAAP
jgi:predicted aspartyl protease